jgi:hypothetical protein
LCRQLAELEEEEGLFLTPFERNLEVWRQLWRVLERSDIVVQVRTWRITERSAVQGGMRQYCWLHSGHSHSCGVCCD